MHFYVYLLLLTIVILLHFNWLFESSIHHFYYIHYLSPLFTDLPPFSILFHPFIKNIQTSLRFQNVLRYEVSHRRVLDLAGPILLE